MRRHHASVKRFSSLPVGSYRRVATASPDVSVGWIRPAGICRSGGPILGTQQNKLLPTENVSPLHTPIRIISSAFLLAHCEHRTQRNSNSSWRGQVPKVGRPAHHVRRCHASFSYQAGSWSKPRRVIAKVEWHPEEVYPRVGFIVTNMSRPAERVVAFYNKRGTCGQWIKEGKGAIKWTRLSCRPFAANAVRLQLHALAYNLGNFLRTLATPEPIKDW